MWLTSSWMKEVQVRLLSWYDGGEHLRSVSAAVISDRASSYSANELSENKVWIHECFRRNGASELKVSKPLLTGLVGALGTVAVGAMMLL